MMPRIVHHEPWVPSRISSNRLFRSSFARFHDRARYLDGYVEYYTWIVKLTMHILLHNCVFYLILIAEFERISRLDDSITGRYSDSCGRHSYYPIGTSGFLLLLNVYPTPAVVRLIH